MNSVHPLDALVLREEPLKFTLGNPIPLPTEVQTAQSAESLPNPRQFLHRDNRILCL
jgi:hypothetical protein